MGSAKLFGSSEWTALVFVSTVLTTNAAQAAVQISSKPTANMSCSSGVCTPTAKKATLNATDLANMLATSDATIKSTGLAQDIEIDAKLSWTSTSKLTLDAYRSITVNKPVEVMGTGSVTITTDDGGIGGDYLFVNQGHVRFYDSHSGLFINGHSYRLYDSLNGLIKELKHTGGSGFLAEMNNWNIKQRWSLSPINKAFSGTFEGLGNTISNLVIQNGSSGGGGFFYTIYFGGVVRDVRLKNATVTGFANFPQYIGLLSAGNSGMIINCVVSGQASALGSGSYVGGLASANDGLISRSGSTATVSGGSGSFVGGLIGENHSFQDSQAKIDQSYATGAVTGGDGSMVGGFVGYNFGTIISNSYATGAALGGNNTFVGGLIGTSADNTDAGFIPAVSASYSTGTVSGGSSAMVGGLIGGDAADAKNTNLYWDMDTSGVSDSSKGAGNIPNDPGITGLSDAQLKSGLPSGFDVTLWRQNARLNGGYPYLIGNPQ